MVGEWGVVVQSVLGAWADVHGGVGELRDIMEEPVVCEDGDRMRVDDPKSGVDDNAGLGADAVTYPAQPQVLDVQYPWR